jgi:hypothetical protein
MKFAITPLEALTIFSFRFVIGALIIVSVVIKFPVQAIC